MTYCLNARPVKRLEKMRFVGKADEDAIERDISIILEISLTFTFPLN